MVPIIHISGNAIPEQGMRQPTTKKEAENHDRIKKDPKVLENMITGLERSYYILNACYSRTVERPLLKHGESLRKMSMLMIDPFSTNISTQNLIFYSVLNTKSRSVYTKIYTNLMMVMQKYNKEKRRIKLKSNWVR